MLEVLNKVRNKIGKLIKEEGIKEDNNTNSINMNENKNYKLLFKIIVVW